MVAVPDTDRRTLSLRRWSTSGRRCYRSTGAQCGASGSSRLEERPLQGGCGMTSNGHRTSDIVIVGAGVMGASIAFHLAQRKAGRILIVDKDHVGHGGSGRSSALVRMHYSFPPEGQLALISLHMFERWQELVGALPLFYKTGFVRIV